MSPYFLTAGGSTIIAQTSLGLRTTAEFPDAQRSGRRRLHELDSLSGLSTEFPWRDGRFLQSRPQKRAGDWRGIQGNFGPPGEQIDVSGMAAYESLDEMLTDDSIDLIDICLPPALHPEAIRKCLAAGKHVLCEKPLALDAATADALAKEAQAGQVDGRPYPAADARVQVAWSMRRQTVAGVARSRGDSSGRSDRPIGFPISTIVNGSVVR